MRASRPRPGLSRRLSPRGRGPITLIALAGATVSPPARAAFLETLVNTPGGVVVAYGGSTESEASAQIIADAIRALPGQEGFGGLVRAEELDAFEPATAAGSHVVAVGTLDDNAILQGRNWLPAWFLDWGYYATRYPYRVSRDEIGATFQPESGFVVGGFGYWPGGEDRIGYVEVDRSPLFMEWMARSRFEAGTGSPFERFVALKAVTAPTYPRDFPLRLIVRVTGSGAEGVRAAAEAFAEQGMLNGAVLAGAAAADGAAQFTLTAERYALTLPFTPPASGGGYAYQGWLLPDAFTYAGFRKTTGLEARVMFRLKYAPATGITNFWTTPHRRATEFEVCAIKLASAEEAEQARAALQAKLESYEGYTAGRIHGYGALVSGSRLYVRSMPDPGGDALLAAFESVGEW